MRSSLVIRQVFRFSMLSTIQLDNQSPAKANKVSYDLSKRHLSAKLVGNKSPVA